jgi:hypothetical protein
MVMRDNMSTKLRLTSLLMLAIGVIGCMPEKNASPHAISDCDASFFGDSTAVFMANILHNGYRISIIHNKQLDLIHFERGDSISQYCAIHKLPFDLRRFEEDSIGVFQVDLDIPLLKIDTLGGSKYAPDMFFMDVNFDGEEDFIVAHEGYNRTYYACFDLVNGNRSGSCPGLLESNNEPPYNNIVSGIYEQPSYTVFNRQKKEIYIYETMGCCSYYETWAKYFEGDNYGNEPAIKVVKQEEHEWWADGKEHIATYKLINDSLKLVETKVIE